MSAPRRNRGRRRPPAAAPASTEPITVDLERFVAGGLALGRQDGGRVVLVEGALPDETAVVELSVDKATLARGVATELRVRAPGRVEPPCPEVAAGCGGCDLQHAALELQRALKVEVVRDALARIGRLGDVQVDPGEHLPAAAQRTVLRCAVVDGRAGLRQRRSDRVRVLDACWVAHPLIDQILAEGRFPGADEVASGSAAHLHEVVGRRRLRISAGSFFQARPDGAEALVRAVQRAIEPFEPSRDRLVDLYGGVGLFTAGLHAQGAVVVERSPSSVADARVNLASLAATVVQADVGEWTPVDADVVVADPARAGLGPAGADAVAGTGAQVVAMVSCDAAALARDARLLVDRGYRVQGVELVDMFPHTHHVEAVTSLRREVGP